MRNPFAAALASSLDAFDPYADSAERAFAARLYDAQRDADLADLAALDGYAPEGDDDAVLVAAR